MDPGLVVLGLFLDSSGLKLKKNKFYKNAVLCYFNLKANSERFIMSILKQVQESMLALFLQSIYPCIVLKCVSPFHCCQQVYIKISKFHNSNWWPYFFSIILQLLLKSQTYRESYFWLLFNQGNQMAQTTKTHTKLYTNEFE